MKQRQPLDDTARKSIADNLRFYADARFKQLTLFITWMTLLAGGLLQFGDKQLAVDLGLLRWIPTAALVVTAVFWIMEIRATLYWRAHRDVSPDLWPSVPKDCWRHVNASNAIFSIYLGAYAIWLAASVKLGASNWAILPTAGLGLLVLAFGISQYFKFSKPGSTLDHE